MPLAPICILYCKQCNNKCINIIYAGFLGLGFQVKNICVMFVFSIASFLLFSEYQSAVDIVEVRIYIWYKSFIGFRGTPLSSRVWLGTVISLVTVGDLRYCFSGEKKWQAIRRWRSRSLMGKALSYGISFGG